MPSETDPSVDSGGLFTTTSTADESIYYVAYRYAFIRPDKSHDDIIRKFLPMDTFLFDVARGGNVPKKIVVVADELIFVGNFKYCFTGHDITIRCRKLIFIPRDDQPVEVDVSGPDLPVDKSVGDNGADGDNGEVGTTSFQYYEKETIKIFHQFTKKTLRTDDTKPSHPGLNGEDGKHGIDGIQGHMGGKFELSFKVIDAPINRGTCFKIFANGGQGGNGGKGGRGGAGGNGAAFDYDRQADNTDMLKQKPKWYKEVYSGGNGGKGGKGGAGGAGGNGGFIKVCNAGTPEKDRQALEAIFDLQAQKGIVGTPGKPGDGGGGGTSSNKPDIIIFYLASSSLTDTPSQVQECAAYWHPDNLNPENGSAGSKGDENAALTEGSNGATIFDYLTKTYETSFTRDTFFLYSLINRMYFDAHNIFSSQKYLPAETSQPIDPKNFQGSESDLMILNARKDYYEVYNWVFAVVNANSTTNKVIKQKLDVFIRSRGGGADIYGFTSSHVSNSRIGTPNIDSIMELYSSVENAFSSAMTAVEGSTRARDELRSKIHEMKMKVANAHLKWDKELKEHNDLHDKVLAAGERINTAHKTLSDATRNLEDKIQNAIHCDVSWFKVIQALAVALMFCHPATAPFAIEGAILSVGAEAYEASSDSLTTIVTDSGAKIDKEILLKQMSVSSQGGNVLAKDLGDNIKKMEDFSAKAVKRIAVEKEKFDRMCDERLGKLGGSETEAGKAAFAAFVDAVSDRSDILQKYNLSIVRLAKLRLEIVDGNESLGIFEGGLPSVSDDHVRLAAEFLKSALSSVSQETFRSLYEFWRAFNCATLGPTTFYESWVKSNTMQTFGNLKADILKINYEQCLEIDQKAWWNRIKDHPRTNESISVSLTAKHQAEKLSALVNNRQMLIDLTWEKALKYGFSPKWFDIRLKGIQVYLFGARVDINKLPLEARGSADADKTIKLTLESSGHFRYIDERAKLHEYSMPSNTFDFNYKILKASEVGFPAGRKIWYPAHKSEEHPRNSDTGVDDAIAYEMVSSLEEGDRFDLALPNLGVMEKFPLQSPLGAWTVYADPSVDLTDVTEVHFVFDLALRTSSGRSV
ncbi:hypothetical protein BHYA_0018g00520 [Botrytis hyacinthi]|uniref:Uncharacterized protein n=1 Tax=Botrytis hyacinthi TaxID=278943 RepID=A0A4Z1H3T5_9HELO|nr:hypothetical protein BHYA_0018g00520 [Botrytis hyacinthi]